MCTVYLLKYTFNVSLLTGHGTAESLTHALDIHDVLGSNLSPDTAIQVPEDTLG
jgi:hypothetical protein